MLNLFWLLNIVFDVLLSIAVGLAYLMIVHKPKDKKQQ